MTATGLSWLTTKIHAALSEASPSSALSRYPEDRALLEAILSALEQLDTEIRRNGAYREDFAKLLQEEQRALSSVSDSLAMPQRSTSESREALVALLEQAEATDDSLIRELFGKSKAEHIGDLKRSLRLTDRAETLLQSGSALLLIQTAATRIVIAWRLSQLLAATWRPLTDSDILRRFQIAKILSDYREWLDEVSQLTTAPGNAPKLLALYRVGAELIDLLNPVEWLKRAVETLLELRADHHLDEGDLAAFRCVRPDLEQSLRLLQEENAIWHRTLDDWRTA